MLFLALTVIVFSPPHHCCSHPVDALTFIYTPGLTSNDEQLCLPSVTSALEIEIMIC